MTSLALRLQVVPGEPVWLDDRDPSDTGGLDRAAAEALFAKGAERLAALQERMFAQRRWAALLVLQGLDASGKDGAIKRLAAGLNPQGLRVTSFGPPNAEERSHDFLWRIHRALPSRGTVGVFNRSHYEDVLVPRVDPGALAGLGLPSSLVGPEIWTQRLGAIVGFENTVAPEVERALLAGHDIVLLGERGQGKTRLVRTLVGLLDEWTPYVAGCEINDHPYAPACVRCRQLVAAEGDATPVAWKHRSERYGEKLATPDTSVGDLIGDVDPIKVAEGRTLGDPETVHYGLVPRTNRGIFSVNELPDLAERIQVALLNVLEERDIQIRGYRVRLPLAAWSAVVTRKPCSPR